MYLIIMMLWIISNTVVFCIFEDEKLLSLHWFVLVILCACMNAKISDIFIKR